MTNQPRAKRLVLVGAGHAHLHCALHADTMVREGIEVTLINPGRFWYSGLATGMLGGMYDAETDQVDAARLVESRGGRFIQDRLMSLDRKLQVAHLASGAELRYDAISLNVGSEVAFRDLPGAETHAWTIKPIANLWRLRQHLEDRFRRGDSPTRVVVVGGGASGCEVVANIDALARRRGAVVKLALVSRSPQLLSRQPTRAARSLTARLERRGITVSRACSILEAESDRLICSDGRAPEYDVLVVATGLQAPTLISQTGLPLGDKGGLLVSDTLQSVADPTVLAVGDCADLRGHSLPRLGVFAVRQAPVLLRNLTALFQGARLETFRPQRRWLSILNLGARQGLALWGPLHWHGRAALWLKDRIDREFLDQYRQA